MPDVSSALNYVLVDQFNRLHKQNMDVGEQFSPVINNIQMH